MSNLSDLTFLRSFTTSDAAKMTKYINMFLSGAPQILSQMKQQVEAADWKALKTSAHSLKTQLKYMGVASAVDLAFAIEQQSGELKDLDQLPELVTRLNGETQLAMAELREEITKL